MRKEKKKRFEAKGWKIGSAKDLLKLSDEESAYIEFKTRLAEGVKQRRQQAGLSQVEFAAKLKSSQSHSRRSRPAILRFDLLIRSLIILGVILCEFLLKLDLSPFLPPFLPPGMRKLLSK